MRRHAPTYLVNASHFQIETRNIAGLIRVGLLSINNGDYYGSRITTLADRHPDSNHFADLAVRRVARISITE